MVFVNRVDAGIRLARVLEKYRDEDAVVIGLPRGGVVTAAEVADRLNAPLDIIVVRKIGHPMAREYAIGAVAEDGEPVWNMQELDATGKRRQLDRAQDLQQTARRMRRRYSSDPLPLEGKVAIIIDDGAATGLTMEAAVMQARRHGALKVVAAAPVAPKDVAGELEHCADEVVILHKPEQGFGSVGQYYADFEQVSDEEVRQFLTGRHDYQAAREPIDIPSLNAVLATVQDYPVSSRTIALKARYLNAPHSVVNFFESIPGEVTFKDKKDVMTRSLETKVIMEEELTSPDEQLRTYD